jgi:hypothetical protein
MLLWPAHPAQAAWEGASWLRGYLLAETSSRATRESRVLGRVLGEADEDGEPTARQLRGSVDCRPPSAPGLVTTTGCDTSHSCAKFSRLPCSQAPCAALLSL